MLLYSPNLYSPITFSDQFAKFNAHQNNHVYGSSYSYSNTIKASIQGLSEGEDLWPKLSNPEASRKKAMYSFAGGRLTFSKTGLGFSGF